MYHLPLPAAVVLNASAQNRTDFSSFTPHAARINSADCTPEPFRLNAISAITPSLLTDDTWGHNNGSQYELTRYMLNWFSRTLHIPRTKNEAAIHVPLSNSALPAPDAILGVENASAVSSSCGRIVRELGLRPNVRIPNCFYHCSGYTKVRGVAQW